MLNEMLLTTILCVAIVGVMALFYGELELLQKQPLVSQPLVPNPSLSARWVPIACTSSSGAGPVAAASA